MNRFPSADRLLEFKAVVEAGSISKAADQLYLTRPTLSRRLNELEASLGLRLLQRTTRDLFLTPAGKELYIRAERIAADVDATWKALKLHDDEPRGPLRISVPESEFAAASLFTEFATEFPKVELDIVVTNRRTDLRAAGIDVALVFGKINDPSLITKSIFSNRTLAMATGSFLAEHGMPDSPEAIQNFDCIVLRNSEGFPEVQWPLASGKTLKVRPRMLTAGFRLMVQAVYAGLGIGMLPESALSKNSDLVALFPDDVVREDHLRLVYVERDFQLPHVRAFIERSDKYWKNWLENW
ncbi:LysR family transcriptional regulator [Ruegeria arenilitoris]|uniref:LysR family transcriptional regulator n=1 Tax=Ruegeria arenilitoris TaxID=1173585 RepID=UPI00147D2D92|nr:LysR family transcriptional regulator [Ruegeria arenilitoris]